MITQQELDALILIIQRAPMNQAEIIAVNGIIEKLAKSILKSAASPPDTVANMNMRQQS